MSNSITISGLNLNNTINTKDFVALVNSASLTTYRTEVQALLNVVAISGSVISSSWSSASLATTSASWSSASLATTSASWASASLTTTSASWASASLTTTSASFALRSLFATSASWASASLTTTSASYAISASRAQTSSFAISASMSTTASYAMGIGSVAGTVPVGTILDFAGAILTDTNYLICTGSSLSTAAWPALFAVLGYTWGGSGPNFSLPDLGKRMTIGKRSSLETWSKLSASVGNTGGDEFYNYHYHAIGTMYIANDDVVFRGWNSAGGYFPISRFPPRTFPLWGAGYYYPFGAVSGEVNGAGTPYQQPTFISGLGGITMTNTALISTSFPLRDTGSLTQVYDYRPATSTPEQIVDSNTDLSMPYAVMNKVIRAL